ncbi:nuclear transport factor 2 family protein [Vibrio sp.]|nr:nuclear transport factor 2 family protein [Vibrio sp.]
MVDELEIQVVEAENQLCNAMLQSDMQVLDELLSDDLTFTNHFGAVLTKQDDIEAHKSGLLKIASITLEDQKVTLQQNTAVVFVKATINGSYDGNPANGAFRFTRVWQKIEQNRWQVIAVHSSMIA